jgi:cytochrome oxidase Cu insertion factor (SCO1/SenC/PrrC family)
MMSRNFRNPRVWLPLCGVVAIVLAGSIFVILRAGSGSNARAATTLSESTWFTGTQWQTEPRIFRAPAFTLPDQSGRTISLRGLRGKVVLLTFTSSVCKGQCPLIGRAAAAAERMLGPLASRTVLANISVDPEADAPSSVAHFIQTIGWNQYGGYYLSAPRPRLRPIWRAYGIYVPTPRPGKGGDPIHTAALALIDQAGNIRGFFSYPFRAQFIARGARDLLTRRA